MGCKLEHRRRRRGFTSNAILSEDEMQSIEGRISKFLYNAMGFLSGFVLGRGREIGSGDLMRMSALSPRP